MAQTIFYFIYDTEIGNLEIDSNGKEIVKIKFQNEIVPHEKFLKREEPQYKFEEDSVIEQCYKEIVEYLKGKRKEFSVPFKLEGTEFQNLVWNALLKIPYGEVRTYKDIAREIGNEKACRAIGMANNKNPIPIIVPCHRVIGMKGDLVGYAGGLEIKTMLLEIEKSKINQFK